METGIVGGLRSPFVTLDGSRAATVSKHLSRLFFLKARHGRLGEAGRILWCVREVCGGRGEGVCVELEKWLEKTISALSRAAGTLLF